MGESPRPNTASKSIRTHAQPIKCRKNGTRHAKGDSKACVGIAVGGGAGTGKQRLGESGCFPPQEGRKVPFVGGLPQDQLTDA